MWSTLVAQLTDGAGLSWLETLGPFVAAGGVGAGWIIYQIRQLGDKDRIIAAKDVQIAEQSDRLVRAAETFAPLVEANTTALRQTTATLERVDRTLDREHPR